MVSRKSLLGNTGIRGEGRREKGEGREEGALDLACTGLLGEVFFLYTY
jgi:hypothetical protein